MGFEVNINYILSELLKLAIPVLVGFCVKFIHDHGLLKKFEAKKGYAKLAVQFVEQVYSDLSGEQKYNKAVDWLSQQLNNAGIKYSDGEIKGLIESAVNEFKSDFKKDINKGKNNNQGGDNMHPDWVGDPGNGGGR